MSVASESGAGGNGILHVDGGETVSDSPPLVCETGTIGGNGIIQAVDGITRRGCAHRLRGNALD